MESCSDCRLQDIFKHQRYKRNFVLRFIYSTKIIKKSFPLWTLDTGHWTMFMIENLIDLLLQELGLSEAVLVWLKVVPDIPGSQQHELAGADWAELHVGQGRQIKSGAELLQLLQPLQLSLPLYLPGRGFAGVETVDHLEHVELGVLLLNTVGEL